MFLNFEYETVYGLRNIICSKFGVMPDDQKLKYLNTELINGKLSFYEIKPEAVIQVRRRRSQKKASLIYVSVKTLTGKTLRFEFDSSQTIKQLRYEIQEMEGNCLFK